MAVQKRVNGFEGKSFTGAYLTGVCRCGKQFNVYAKLPETVEVSCGGEVFKAKPAEHLIIICPSCRRIVNCGNGSRRSRFSRHRGL